MNNEKFRILVIGNKERFIHLNDFLHELNKKNISTKLIYDLDYVTKFFDLNVIQKQKKKRSIEKILETFNPDIVLLDRISKIVRIIIPKNIPIWILLRGNYWEETKWAKNTIYTSKKDRLSLQKNEELVDYCFNNCELILPISKYLEEQVRKRYPNKNIKIFPADGRNPNDWNIVESKKLKHPCVGLLQGLNVWGKTKELLLLDKVMKELPEVTFYLAGTGIYENRIIPKLNKNKNFIWLKHINYSNEVKEFLSEIDVYLLLSGLEGLGQTIIESLLMKRPTIASNVGGIPELIKDNETGFLVQNGSEEEIVSKISKILANSDLSERISTNGHAFVKKEFSWQNIAEKFVSILKAQSG